MTIVNKQVLSEKISTQFDISVSKAQSVVEALFEEIMRQVSEGKKVRIVGFGSFQSKTRAERTGRDPNTGAPITLPETKTAHFQAGKHFNEKIKGR